MSTAGPDIPGGASIPAGASLPTGLEWAKVLSQAARLLTLSSPQPDAALVVERFAGHEALDACGAFTIDCLCGSTRLALAAFLGEELTLRVRLADGGQRAWHGLVSDAALLGGDGGLVRYRLTLRPWLHRLSHVRTSRIFQDATVDEVVRAVFDGHAGATYRFAHSRPLVRRPYIVQYRESDLAFVERLLASEGLSYRIEHDQNADPAAPGGEAAAQARHSVVVFDGGTEAPACPLDPIRYHRLSATESEDGIHGWQETRSPGPQQCVRSQWDHARLVAPASDAPLGAQGAAALPHWPELEDHAAALAHPFVGPQGAATAGDVHQDTVAQQAAWAAAAHALRQHHIDAQGSVRVLAPGQVFSLAGHPSVAADARFRVQAVWHEGANNLVGGMRAIDAGPGGTAEAGTYRNRTRLAPASLVCVPQPIAKPAAPGLQTAIVVGHADAPAGTGLTSDRDGRVKVQFPWQRGARPLPGGAMHDTERATGDATNGIWLRVAEQLAGPDWGSVFTPRVGSEVLVDFVGGDLDHPLVVAQLYNGAAPPPWPAGEGSGANHPGVLAGIHAPTTDGAGWSQWLIDDSAGQLRTRLASAHAASQLGLGHLIAAAPTGPTRGNWRGSGFELNTAGWGQTRAARGLLLSTGARAQAASVQLDAAEALAQLRAAQDLHSRLADAASQSQTPAPRHAPAIGRLIDTLEPAPLPADGTDTPERALHGFAEPLLAAHSAASLVLASPQSASLHAGGSLIHSVQGDIHQASGHTHSVIAGGQIGLHSSAGGLAAVAAHGPVSLHAHDGPLDILAEGSLTLTSSADGLYLLAQEKVVLQAGQSRIELAGGNITFSCPGAFTVKGASKVLAGGGSAAASLDDLPAGRLGELPNWLDLELRGWEARPVGGVRYTVTFADGTQRRGTLDANGFAHLENVPAGGQHRVDYDNPPSSEDPPAYTLSDLARAIKAYLGS